MDKNSIIFLLALILFASFLLIDILPEGLSPLSGFGHLISFILGGIGVYFSVLIKKRFGKIMGKSYNYIILGLISLMLSHASEFVLLYFEMDHNFSEYVMHAFFGLGFILLIFAFYKLVQNIPND